jgi:uncharacterized repeat protein (TIGR01451 family)
MERWMLMKLALVRQTMALFGIVLIVAALLPGAPASTMAAPLMLVTDTSTAEPPSPTFTSVPPTNTPTSTPIGPTNTPTSTPIGPTNTSTPIGPSSTPVVPTNTPGGPTNTPIIPTDEPTNPPEDRNTPVPTNTSGPTNTAVPTAPGTPLPSPSSTTIPGPDLTLDKSVSGAVEARVGDTIEYRVFVRNNGSEPATDVVVEDRLPGFLQLVSAAASRGEVTTSGSTVRVVIGTLQPGEEVVIVITARILSYVPADQSGNFASATGSNVTDPPANNSDEARIVIVQPTPAAPNTLPRTNGPEDAWRVLLLSLGIALLMGSMLVLRRPSRRG